MFRDGEFVFKANWIFKTISHFATKKFIFEVDGDDAEIKVKVDDGFFNRNWSSDGSDLTIYIPKSSSIEAGGVSTDFDVDGVQGGIRVNSVSGSIEVQDIAKSLNLESVSGDIDVADSLGKMRLVSVSGDVQVEGKAKHFDVSTVSGDIEANIGLTELIDLTSVSGDLEIQFDLQEEGRLEAGTVSGDVTLSFGDDDINASFDINTGPGGDIRNARHGSHETSSGRPQNNAGLRAALVADGRGPGSAGKIRTGAPTLRTRVENHA